MSNILDTRDLDERLQELEDMVAYIEEDEDCSDTMDDEEKDELEELRSLKDEIGDEWRHGVTLIPEDDFVDYCKEMLEDCGDIPENLPHYIVVDWEATSRILKQDYAEVEYQGEAYLYRA